MRGKTSVLLSIGSILSSIVAVVACGSDSDNNHDAGQSGSTSLVAGSGGKPQNEPQSGATATAREIGGNGGGSAVHAAGASSSDLAGGATSSGVGGSGEVANAGGGSASGGNAAGGIDSAVGGNATGVNATGGVDNSANGGTAGAAGAPAAAGSGEPGGAPNCPSGSFDADASANCVDWTTCVPGQQVLSPGTSTQDRTCSNCASGFLSTTENAASCSAWSDCPAGTYVSNAPSTTSDRTCADCGAGTFTAVANLSACTPHQPCAAGTVQSLAGTSTSNPGCAACQPGNYCAGATASSQPCAASTWDHDLSPATACVAKRQCAANEYVTNEGDAVTDRTCTRACTGMQCGTDHGISCGTCGGGGTCNTETNQCIPPWTLTSVSYSGKMMIGANNYGNMCAHLVTEDYDIVWTLVTCCDPGPCSQPINDPMWTTEDFKPGAPVMLCHGNNYNICSNVVTISE